MIKNLRIRLTAIFTTLTGLILAVVVLLNGWFYVSQIEKENKRYMLAASDQIFAVLQNAFFDTSKFSEIDFSYNTESPYFVVIRINGEDKATFGNLHDGVDKDKLLEKAVSIQKSSIKSELVDQRYLKDAYESDIITYKFNTEAILSNEDSQAGAVVIEGSKDRAKDITNSKAETPQIAPSAETKAELAESSYYSSAIIPFTISSLGSDSDLDTISTFKYDGRSFQSLHIPLFIDTYMENESFFVNEFEIYVIEDLENQNQRMRVVVLGYVLLYLMGLALLTFASWMFAKLVIKPTEESIQRQTDFVAAASHELRSPLAVIRSSLSAADSCENQNEAKKYRNAAESEADRMARLIDDLLLLAGGDAGNWKIQSSNVDLDTVLIETNEQFFPLAKQKKLELDLELPEEALPVINGDKLRLRQILAVLMDNAIQYAPENSTVTIKAEQVKNKVLIDIIDHGSGISEENRAFVFDRFYRADKSRSDKNHFGLGLSVAKELAELHGGSLTAHESEGGGATFRLTLPVAAKS